MKIIAICFFALALTASFSKGEESGSRQRLSYAQINPEPSIKGLVLPGRVFRSGSNVVGSEDAIITNVMRFANIAEAVERRYGLSNGIILAIVAVRSGGVELMPDRTDRGGVGLCFMSASQASTFGLRTYQVCTLGANRDCAAELRKLLAAEERDYGQIVAIDERLHPITSLDAAARILLTEMNRSKGGDPLKFALQRMTGTNNVVRVLLWQKKLADPEKLAHAETTFNRLNSGKLTINGLPGTFRDYVAACQRHNENYGLASYRGRSVVVRNTAAESSR